MALKEKKRSIFTKIRNYFIQMPGLPGPPNWDHYNDDCIKKTLLFIVSVYLF